MNANQRQRRRRIFLTASAAAVVLAGRLALPIPVLAQGVENVRLQLAIWASDAYAEGYRETHDVKLGTLNEGESETFEIVLLRGWRYRILAACDADCVDLDLALYDESENTIDVDYLLDALPEVGVTPRWSGSFTLDVAMPRCYVEPCFFGVTVLGAPTSSF